MPADAADDVIAQLQKVMEEITRTTNERPVTIRVNDGSPIPDDQWLCDFCNSTSVRWENRCEDDTMVFVGDGGRSLETRSNGSWSACGPCQRLINQGDRKRLAKRSARKFTRRTSEQWDWKMIMTVQRRFWTNRSSAPPIDLKRMSGQEE